MDSHPKPLQQMAGESLLLAYVGIAAVFSYLAINLDEEHGHFKLLNLGVAYLTTALTTYIAIPYTAEEYPGTDLHNMVSGIGEYYTYLLIFIMAYFVFYILYKIMKDMVKL